MGRGAVAGKADVLVTGDFALLEATTRLPLPVVNPRGLWDRLRTSKSRR
jgi:predicted nucleic acid-binding protein